MTSALVANALKRVIKGDNLSEELMAQALGDIMDGGASDAQIAALLIALRMKGETVDEIAGAVNAMRSRVAAVNLAQDAPIVVDTCGTGGDGAGTFNISTAVSMVCAAAGCVVAKHGNRAISSRVGSADVLEALGVRIDLNAAQVRTCIETVGIGFMFAPTHHAALRHAMPARKQLGVRTLLNLLGPMTNPAGATHQLIGLFTAERLVSVAEVLARLGTRRALVVHGEDGLDEITLGGVTHAAFLDAGEVTRLTLTPEAVGLQRADAAALAGGDAAYNAALIRQILGGERHDAPADIVALNAGAALWVAERAEDLGAGVRLARELLRSAKPLETLNTLAALTQKLGP